MVTNAVILPGDEIYNSYDSSLSNVHLMIQYGFFLEGNSNDVIQWELDEVDQVLNTALEDDEDYLRKKLWSMYANHPFANDANDKALSHLIYTPNQGAQLPEDETTTETPFGRVRTARPATPPRYNIDPRTLLLVNAEGQISQQLWLYLLLLRLPRRRIGSLLEDSEPMVLVYFRNALRVDSDELRAALGLVGRDVQNICGGKIEEMGSGKGGISVPQLGEMLEVCVLWFLVPALRR